MIKVLRVHSLAATVWHTGTKKLFLTKLSELSTQPNCDCNGYDTVHANRSFITLYIRKCDRRNGLLTSTF